MTAPIQERRDVPLPLKVETRADGKPMIRGMAARYGVRSVDLGRFTEEIKPGAFDNVMRAEGRNVVGLFNHEPNYVLGTERAGTLRLAATADGLAYELDPPSTREDVVELIQRGDVWGSSFAFTVAEGGDEWTTDENGGHLRYIRAIGGLYDVGPVLTPAYRDTTVAVRSLERHLQTHRPALVLPALNRDAKTETALRTFLERHGRKIG
jgi:HK97 family phage prohead protease